MSTVIETIGLTKSYGARRGIVDVTFAVGEGEVFGFLGPNGAGKTTTIRILLGLLRPTAAGRPSSASTSGRDAPRLHRRLAYLGSDPGYLGELTAADAARLPRPAARPAARRLAADGRAPRARPERPDPQAVARQPPEDRRRAGVHGRRAAARSSTSRPAASTRSCSASSSRSCREVRAAGRTVFLSSHNLPEVERSCDRVGIIREGRLIEITTVQALLAGHWRSVNLVLGAIRRRREPSTCRTSRSRRRRPATSTSWSAAT